MQLIVNTEVCSACVVLFVLYVDVGDYHCFVWFLLFTIRPNLIRKWSSQLRKDRYEMQMGVDRRRRKGRSRRKQVQDWCFNYHNILFCRFSTFLLTMFAEAYIRISLV
jgi:hypothetical protein